MDIDGNACQVFLKHASTPQQLIDEDSVFRNCRNSISTIERVESEFHDSVQFKNLGDELMGKRKNWLTVDMDGLKKILERRGKVFAIFELVQNAWDENVTKVEVTLARPENGKSELIVTDDSPEGFRDLTDSYTMFAESYKKANPEKRGAFNLGEKYVLALCDEASITTTTGHVKFDADGRHPSGKAKLERGSEFRGSLRLKIGEWQEMRAETLKLIPPVPTCFNGKEISPREPIRTWDASLVPTPTIRLAARCQPDDFIGLTPRRASSATVDPSTRAGQSNGLPKSSCVQIARLQIRITKHRTGLGLRNIAPGAHTTLPCWNSSREQMFR